MEFAEAVYFSLIGELIEPVPDVRNAFGAGEPCAEHYAQAQEAYERLRKRLGVVDEDGDVETMIDSLLMIQKDLCVEMFELGRRFA